MSDCINTLYADSFVNGISDTLKYNEHLIY
jgi:hypothetical protein